MRAISIRKFGTSPLVNSPRHEGRDHWTGVRGAPACGGLRRGGLDVVGVDADARKVERLHRSESDIEDVASERLREVAERFTATTEHVDLQACDALLICVPTPLANQREPDLSYIVDAATALSSVPPRGPARRARVDHLPGHHPRAAAARSSRSPASRPARDFHLAFSPERIDPGRSDHPLADHPEGRRRPHRRPARERARDLYELICDEVVVVSSPEAAELSKLLENIFRSVNIALVNELAQLCDRMDIDIWEVIDAASTKPFGFMRFEPGPGMGGHCLPVDPFYLAFKAREYDFYPEFIELAGKINQSPAALLRREGADGR